MMKEVEKDKVLVLDTCLGKKLKNTITVALKKHEASDKAFIYMKNLSCKQMIQFSSKLVRTTFDVYYPDQGRLFAVRLKKIFKTTSISLRQNFRLQINFRVRKQPKDLKELFEVNDMFHSISAYVNMSLHSPVNIVRGFMDVKVCR